MSDMPDEKTDWTPAGLKAWNLALVKTGTEHLDLDMVRQGKNGLKEAAAKSTASPSKPAA